ncbi:MAG: Hsp20 family protein [Pseudomonadota bacterium]
MRNFDLAPLYRATVGFDRFADLVDTALRADAGNQPSYPPFNIEKTADDAYLISIAAAGFREEDLNIEVRENALIVSAKKTETEENRTYLHRGIANRAFERRFHLADHVRVSGAKLENGMLGIELVREIPEALKPRRIEISGPTSKVVEGTAAA